jgi:glutathione synthase/RimK-type ligase-like ATP-grasp enzyme
MHFLLYSTVTGGTGKALAEKLGIACGDSVPNDSIDLLIRWGSSAPSPKFPKRVLNNKNAISLASDKFTSLLKLKEGNIPVPKLLPITELQQLTLKEIMSKGLSLPVLARKPKHTRGRDILLCLQNKDIRRAVRWEKTFIIEYIPTEREYRVHVFGNEIIRTSQKVLMSRDNYLPYMRNDDHNHTFRNPRVQLTEHQKSVAINAVKVLGLDFGAVDMVISDDGNPFVLEINTGPSLIENGIEIYEQKFRNIIQEMTNALPTE